METLSFEWADEKNKIGILKLNRPKALNALNAQLFSELSSFLDDSTIKPRVLIFTGEGEKSFVAGADIKEMQDHDSDAAYKMASFGQKIFSKIENLNYVTIAAVNGFALGGGMELSLSCDMIFAKDTAKFGLPEVSLGLIPGYGGTQRLSRAIGLQKAKHMVFTGDIFSAEQMKSWGLVCDVYKEEDFMEQVFKTAKSISRKGPLAIKLAKKAMHEGYSKPLDQALELEAKAFKDVFATKDHNEGIAAFVEKRKPQFIGE